MDEKKRICMIVQDPRVKGGIAAVVNGYRGSQLEKDFDIIYVESYRDGGKLTKLIKGICGLLHFAKVLLIDKPNLVHIHSSFGPSFYRKMPFIYLASWAGIPIINHIHGSDYESLYMGASDVKKRLVEKIYRKCSVLIALSDESKEKLSHIVSKKKIIVIENYAIVHEDAVNERNNKKPINQVLFLGKIERNKGCYDIPAIVKIVANIFPDVKFILGGSGDIDQIKRLIKQNGVEQNIEFPGWVSGAEKDNLLRTSDIFFLPSYNEGMPMSILEAMGYGLPIVSTCVGGIPRIVRHGENGFVYKPGDIDGMASGIIKLLSSQDLQKSFGYNSYRIICEKYTLKQHIAQIKKLYEKNCNVLL